jgi:hypothetical protein
MTFSISITVVKVNTDVRLVAHMTFASETSNPLNCLKIKIILNKVRYFRHSGTEDHAIKH